ncbi:GATA transcription factor 19 [Punica granatum]|uniref:GATA-type domain-containing protein n=2 Tax=Punica granatum TaxID=22663 RepID=A0A218W0L9_PUNGR|nr:GATA transcription factor 19 [Punica granatum]OWM66377.1 hypothetical protein CDL15_Pgr013594 [Punica granatum]PKI63656.1 hypothetical protein CRG98_015944 [Punica granatum]
MHRCESSNNMVGPGSCSCGGYHHAQSSPLSVLYPDPYSYPNPYPYSYSLASGSASVDCTLSLGTPSTRLSEDVDDSSRRSRGSGQERRSSISNFCWDILQTTKHGAPSSGSQSNKSAGRGNSSGGDPLLARRCANCDTTSTPLWRNGPRGPKSLCNACGIRFKKEERRATAAAASASSMDAQSAMFSHGQYGSWAAAAAAQPHHQKLPSCLGTEFRFMEDEAQNHSDNGISFLSWRLNVTDRPSGLIHDFTR